MFSELWVPQIHVRSQQFRVANENLGIPESEGIVFLEKFSKLDFSFRLQAHKIIILAKRVEEIFR